MYLPPNLHVSLALLRCHSLVRGHLLVCYSWSKNKLHGVRRCSLNGWCVTRLFKLYASHCEGETLLGFICSKCLNFGTHFPCFCVGRQSKMDVCTELSTCTELQITIWLFNICVFGVLNQQCRAACVLALWA